jgi:hypothetical protein
LPFIGSSDPLFSQIGDADWDTTVAGREGEADESARF